jgi:D-alanyl-D-alanine carboxypeptidase/D-alanyl-D-alanine carboxypeptidase (penicillin-binding protein 5/6)
MALLGCCAMRNFDFLKACSTYSAKLCYGNEPYTRYLTNHNKLLKSFDGTIGIKTGFTKKSGRCLVSAVLRNGVTLVCVTLNAPDDWNDHKKMFEYGFERVTVKNIDTELPYLKVIGGDEDFVPLSLACDLQVPSASDISDFEVELCLKHFEYAPIRRGEPVGEVRIISGGNLILSSAVIADKEVLCTTEEKIDNYSVLNRIKKFFYDLSLNIKSIFKRKADGI